MDEFKVHLSALTLVHVNGMSLGRLSTKCWTNRCPRTSSAVAAPHTLSSFSPASIMRMSRLMTTPNGKSRRSSPMGMDGSCRLRSKVCTAACWSTNALLSKSNRYLTRTFCMPFADAAADAAADMCEDTVVVFSHCSTRILRFVSYTSSAI